jgi:hypothetical protein
MHRPPLGGRFFFAPPHPPPLPFVGMAACSSRRPGRCVERSAKPGDRSRRRRNRILPACFASAITLRLDADPGVDASFDRRHAGGAPMRWDAF